MLGQRLPDAHIGVLGSDLPLHNPVQLAEEYSMLDNLLAGRLTIGLLRGTPNEYMTYGTNPWDSKEAFKEGVRLFIRALTEPEPFGWEGRYYRHRNVSIWPQPLQRPHPRILLSGNSPDSARFAGEMHCDLGFSFMPAEKCAENLEHYRAGAADAGWEPTADNILYRQFCFVHEDESEAHKAGADLGGLFAGGSMDLMMTMGMIGAAMNGVPKGVQIDPSKAPGMSFSPGWYGTPEQALAGIEAIHSVVGMGRVEFIVGGTPKTPHEAVVAVASADGRDDRARTARRSLLVGGRLMAGEKLVEKSVEADGFTIRYWEEGEGDPVVVLHGAGGPVPSVALDLLSAQNRILLFELPGWGEQPNDRSQSLVRSREHRRRGDGCARPRARACHGHVAWWCDCAAPRARPSRAGRRRWCSSRRPPSALAACRPRASRPSRWRRRSAATPTASRRGRAPTPSGWVVHGRSSSVCSWRRPTTTRR